MNSIAELQALTMAGFSDWKQHGAVAVKRMDNLILFNYTPEAIFTNQWTWFERVSRGLILNIETGEVVARPFDKFFNWNEGGRMPLEGSMITAITEKMDGSMGVLYRHNGQMRIATRGSFESEQALWATEFVNRVHPVLASSEFDAWTFLFEIIYPDNRIVVDYGADEKLVLLAMRQRHTGEYLASGLQAVAYSLGIPFAPVHTFEDMDAVLAATPSIEHEGYVIEMSDGSRWKIKGDKYRALHKIISQVSFNAVLDAVIANGWHEYRLAVPEEFHPEIDGYYAEITQSVDLTDLIVRSTMTPELITGFITRKDMALWVQQQPRDIQRFYFNHFDGKYQRSDILKMIPRRNTRTIVERGEV